MNIKRTAAALLAALMLLPMILMTGCIKPEPIEPDPTEPAQTEPAGTEQPKTGEREPGSVVAQKVDYPVNPYKDDPFGMSASDSVREAWNEAMRIRREAAKSAADIDAFTKALTEKLMEGSGDDNLVFSPANIFIALSMLAEVTDGNTRSEILRALGAANMPSLRDGVAALMKAETVDDGVTTSLLANSLWLNMRYGYNTETLERIAKNYSASSYWGDPVDPAFVQALRDWLNDNTGGLLKDAADGIKLNPQTVLAICSTIYFKAPWADSFNKDFTDRMTFHAASGDMECEFMHTSLEHCRYYEGRGFTAAEIPVEGGSVWFLLPDEGKDVGAMMKDGGLDFILGSKEDCGIPTVRVSMPKIDVSSDLDLIPALQEMGLNECFVPGVGDFTPLTTDSDELFVSRIKHAARVKTDEDGIEAAAFTVIMVEDNAISMPDRIVDFTLDRPFAFVVTGETDAPLFVGVVNTLNN